VDYLSLRIYSYFVADKVEREIEKHIVDIPDVLGLKFI